MIKDFKTEKRDPLPTGEHPWAKRLRRTRKTLSAIEFLISLGLTIWLIFSKAADQWADVVSSISSSWPVRALLFSAGLSAIYSTLTFPLSFYKSYIVEKRFDLSTQTLKGWISDRVKGLLLGAALGSIVVLGLTATLVYTGSSWWWITSLGAVFFGILITRLAPQIILPLFFKMKSLESAELQARFSRLAQKTKTPVLGIFEIDMSRRTRAANAAVIGFGKTRRAIVGDTLLTEFTMDEAEFVLAHELAHHKYHDLWTGIALSGAVMLLALGLTHIAMTRIAAAVLVTFPLQESVQFNPLILFLIAVLSSVFTTILSPIPKFLSRFAESRADRFAAQTTNALSGANAFRKLGYQNIAVFRPPSWEEKLMYTHPCIARRIERLEQTH